MKKTYHICLSSRDEVLFRDHDDYIRGYNYFAYALYRTDSVGLADAFMSNHVHLLIQTSVLKKFLALFRQIYTLYFNHKYDRKGKIGEKQFFYTEVKGYYHLIAAVNYVLRNPLHHGVVPIPYSYPYSTANAIFQKDMGKESFDSVLPEEKYHRFIGRKIKYPKTYKMKESGEVMRTSVMDIVQLENLYISPRSFNFNMTRRSSEEWQKEQEKDNNSEPPITLDVIEMGVNLTSMKQMIDNEYGKSNYQQMTDIELCKKIDEDLLKRYRKNSVYLLTDSEKDELIEYLYWELHLPDKQIKRCLAIKEF